MKNKDIAVIIPCYNEEVAIKHVVKDFNKVLPNAEIYVFDNNSKDKTSEVAKKAGATVKKVSLQGKGNVVRRMFADVEADVYVMVDGDNTYEARAAVEMIKKLYDDDLDMVVGCRVEDSKDNDNYRKGHRFGNLLLTGFVKNIFGGNFTDMLSGYRVFSRRFAKSFTANSAGFETETELTIHTLEMKMPYGEIKTMYGERPEGSVSKLSTYKDGIRILKAIFRLYFSERPRQFLSIIGTVLLLISIALFIPVLIGFFETHEVDRFPTLMVSLSIALAGFMCYIIGVVLHFSTKTRKEAKYLQYLQLKSVQNEKKYYSKK